MLLVSNVDRILVFVIRGLYDVLEELGLAANRVTVLRPSVARIN
jgi:hypothetical protein